MAVHNTPKYKQLLTEHTEVPNTQNHKTHSSTHSSTEHIEVKNTAVEDTQKYKTHSSTKPV